MAPGDWGFMDVGGEVMPTGWVPRYISYAKPITGVR